MQYQKVLQISARSLERTVERQSNQSHLVGEVTLTGPSLSKPDGLQVSLFNRYFQPCS